LNIWGAWHGIHIPCTLQQDYIVVEAGWLVGWLVFRWLVGWLVRGATLLGAKTTT
jgi:hypothetical protein